MNFETNRVSQIKLYLILDSFVLILPFLIGLPITLAEKRYGDLLVMLSIYIPFCIVVIVQFILLRKYYLGKVFVNEEGVGYKYKNEVYKLFKWEEIIKVEIGNAKGQNWWCVMFPPLCFVDVTSGIVPEESKENLQDNLGEEEYDIISNTEDSEIVNFKFKIVEFFEILGIQLANN